MIAIHRGWPIKFFQCVVATQASLCRIECTCTLGSLEMSLNVFKIPITCSGNVGSIGETKAIGFFLGNITSFYHLQQVI